ncbi:MAG: dethiobiotin synthase [Zymomonas mobilis]|uniref:ATP-dependent dethiobiotin synthetase BioD n=1 Tax=Zymomonas mobilis TaxID=542 RepID=A0A542VYX5_ZYMMB|nr:dethiobiotin synthase [Zymomonas mobilis]TQL16525.1 malonyl-CoA O-methyltransferase [Zymomonas mobilis]
MINPDRKIKIIERFSQASGYDQAASIQRVVAKRLADKIKTSFPDHSVRPIKILEFGCGTGFLTEELIHLFPKADITVSDISADMLGRAKAKFGKAQTNTASLTFEIMDAENPPEDSFYDLICSSLSMQWFTNRRESLSRLVKQLNPNGWLWVSTLCDQSFHEWRRLYNLKEWACPILACAEVSQLKSDWPVCGHGEWVAEKIIDCPENGLDFLRHLKKIGASLPQDSVASLSAPNLKTLLKLFDQGNKKITYHIGYGSFEKMPRKGVFVTGTDTGIGKTLVSACLIKAWNGDYWKPLQTGLAEEEGDSATVTRLANLSSDRIILPAITLSAPLSPEAAARQENRVITENDLSFPPLFSSAPLVVEGAGGLMVPITAEKMMIDFIQDCKLPVILVARSGLGTINHTLLSLEALRLRKIPIAGVILSGATNYENRQAIENYGKIRVLAEIPLLDRIDPEQVAAIASEMPAFDDII